MVAWIRARGRFGAWVVPALVSVTGILLWELLPASDPSPRGKKAVFAVGSGGSDRPPLVATGTAWRPARVRLEGAHESRRSGLISEAILGYGLVAATSNGRIVDRQAARAWCARLRLERGERSALDDLLSLSMEPLPPQLYAHIATSASRANWLTEDDRGRVTQRAVLDAVTRQLSRSSSVHGGAGERAQRWLARVHATRAQIFSP